MCFFVTIGEVLRFGAHTVRLEDPFLTVYHLRDTLNAPELALLAAPHRQWIEGLPYFLVLCDATDLEHVTPDVFQQADTWGEIAVPRAFAVVTKRFVIRTAAELITRSIQFVWNSPLETRFFLNTASARVWLEDRRHVYAMAAEHRTA